MNLKKKRHDADNIQRISGLSKGYHRRWLFLLAAAAVLSLAQPAKTNAVGIGDYASPHFACDAYRRSGPPFVIVRDQDHDCLIRVTVGSATTYTHFYDSGTNYCLEVTGNYGRISGPNCVAIDSTNRPATPGKIDTPPSFWVRTLQYSTLPTGKPVKAGENERLEVKMPDGSLIQLDKNSTFTPVSEKEVQTAFGRFRFLLNRFHGPGQCLVSQKLQRENCLIIKTKFATIGDQDTEILVDNFDEYTQVSVISGNAGVYNPEETSLVTLGPGQRMAFSGQGHTDKEKFDPATLDQWWTQRDALQNFYYYGIPIIAAVVAIPFLLMLFSWLGRLLRHNSVMTKKPPSKKRL